MAKRSRGFAFILYPESAPENWRDIINEYHIQWAESPLHCFDVEPTGEVKKPHWHIVFVFEGPKSFDQVNDLIKPLNGTIPIGLDSIRGMIRYFAHLDNPEKYQYPVEQIIGHGGIDIQDIMRVSPSARYKIIRKICDYVAATGITELYQLMDYAAEEHPEDWYPVLCDSAGYIVSQYIKSNRNRPAVDRREGFSND